MPNPRADSVFENRGGENFFSKCFRGMCQVLFSQGGDALRPSQIVRESHLSPYDATLWIVNITAISNITSIIAHALGQVLYANRNDANHELNLREIIEDSSQGGRFLGDLPAQALARGLTKPDCDIRKQLFEALEAEGREIKLLDGVEDFLNLCNQANIPVVLLVDQDWSFALTKLCEVIGESYDQYFCRTEIIKHHQSVKTMLGQLCHRYDCEPSRSACVSISVGELSVAKQLGILPVVMMTDNRVKLETAYQRVGVLPENILHSFVEMDFSPREESVLATA